MVLYPVFSIVGAPLMGEVLLRLIMSGLCGALIGWERQIREKAAGLTHL